MIEVATGVLSMAITMLWLFPRQLAARHDAREAYRRFALACVGGALLFFAAAVGFAYYDCHRPPPDGFCFFSGLPFLSFSASFLLISFFAQLRRWQLGRRKPSGVPNIEEMTL